LRQPLSVHVFLYHFKGNNPEYLILNRFPMPQINLPAFWQGVTGGLEDNETFIEAAIREVHEETGIKIQTSRNPVLFTPSLFSRNAESYTKNGLHI